MHMQKYFSENWNGEIRIEPSTVSCGAWAVYLDGQPMGRVLPLGLGWSHGNNPTSWAEIKDAVDDLIRTKKRRL